MATTSPTSIVIRWASPLYENQYVCVCQYLDHNFVSSEFYCVIYYYKVPKKE